MTNRTTGWGIEGAWSNDDNTDVTRYNSFARRNQLYDDLTGAAGDDGLLSADEIWAAHGKNMVGKYNMPTGGIRETVARFAQKTGTKLSDDALDRWDLKYDGKDLLGKWSWGHHDQPHESFRHDGSVSFLRGIDDGDDDGWDIFKFKYLGDATSDDDDDDDITTTTTTVADDSSFKKEVELDPLTQTPRSQKYTGFVPSDALIQTTAQNQGGWDKLADTTNLFEYGFKNDGTKLTNNEFITKAYQNVYDRNPDAASLAHWNEKFSVGADGKTGTTYKDMLIEMNDSDEGRLNRLYKNIFDRPLAKAGKEYWLDGDMKNLMADGKTRDEAWSIIKSNIMNMGQDEFKDKWDGYDPWDAFQNASSTTSNTNTISTSQDAAASNTSTTSSTSSDNTNTSTFDPYYGMGETAFNALSASDKVRARNTSDRKQQEATIASQGTTNRQSLMEFGELGSWAIKRLPDNVGTTSSIDELIDKYTNKIKSTS